MAPHWPEEVDVFSEPHSRMKKLVHKYSIMVSDTDFTDEFHMTILLQNLTNVFYEFKAHENIENILIMRNLKRKLKAACVTSAAVCNCHSDNRLTDMLEMVVDGLRSRWTEKSINDRQSYGRKLQKALEDFTQNFIPHMEEEEEVFQPMLMQYFSYEELKELKAKVIHEHLLCTQREKFVEDLQSDETPVVETQPSYFDLLPDEICEKVFSYLNPQELGKAAQTCHRWNRMTKDPVLWTGIYPVHWAAGNWTFHPEPLGGVDGAGEFDDQLAVEFDPIVCHDEDADVDESSSTDETKDFYDEDNTKILKEAKLLSALVKHLLPVAGSGVKVVDLAYSKGLSSSLVHKILKLCPNTEVLDLTHTLVGDAAFHEYGASNRQSKLRRLDLTNCHNITDEALFSLVGVSVRGKDWESYTEDLDKITDRESRLEREVDIESAPVCCHQEQIRCCNGTSRSNSISSVTNCSVDADRRANVGCCGRRANEVELSYKEKCDQATNNSQDSVANVCDNISNLVIHNHAHPRVSVNTRSECVSPTDRSDIALESHVRKQVCPQSSRSESSLDSTSSFESDSECGTAYSACSSISMSPPPSPSPFVNFMEDSLNVNSKACCSNKPVTHDYIVKKPCCVSSSNHPCSTMAANENGVDNYEDDVGPDPNLHEMNDFQSIKPLIRLEFLSLNGCFLISDQGLSALSLARGTPRLCHLDLSGCLGLTGRSIECVVSTCGPQFDHTQLFYCHNIPSDPHPTTASGCRNLGCGTRFCCSVD